MSDIFKSYLSEDERAVAIEESTYEIQMAKLNAMYEMVDKNLELNMLEAEAKVLTESGTYDDLDYLYEEANAEAVEKKKGIIGKIVGVVKSIWQAITNAITNFLSKSGNVEDEVEVDENDEKRMNALNAVWGKIKQVLNFVRNNGGKIAIGITLAGTAILGGLELFGKKGGKVKKPSSVVKGWIQNIKSKAGEVNSALSSAGGDGDEKKKALEILSEVGKKLKSWIDSLTSKLGNVVSSAKEAITDKEGRAHAKAVKDREKNGGVKDAFGHEAQAEQKKKDLDNGKYPGDKGLSNKREVSPKDLAQDLVQADRSGKETGRYKDATEVLNAMDKADKVSEERRAKYGKKETETEEPEVDKKDEKAQKKADKKQAKEHAKAVKKREKNGGKKHSWLSESYEEGTEGETVLESTDTIFGYDLSNEIQIQENEVYESVMEEIDDLLENL